MMIMMKKNKEGRKSVKVSKFRVCRLSRACNSERKINVSCYWIGRGSAFVLGRVSGHCFLVVETVAEPQLLNFVRRLVVPN